MLMIVVIVDNFMKNFIDFRFTFRIHDILRFQSIRTNRSTNTRFRTKFRITNEIVQNSNPRIMTRTIIIIIRCDFVQLNRRIQNRMKSMNQILLVVMHNREYWENHDLEQEWNNENYSEYRWKCKTYVHCDNRRWTWDNSMDHSRNTFHNLRRICNVLESNPSNSISDEEMLFHLPDMKCPEMGCKPRPSRVPKRR